MLDNGEFLRGAADAGDLRVNPDEAQNAVNKLERVAAKLDDLASAMDIGAGGGSLELGDNVVGDAIAKKSNSKASGADSLRAALELLKTQAHNAHYAVNKAMQNYRYTDESGAQKFRTHS